MADEESPDEYQDAIESVIKSEIRYKSQGKLDDPKDEFIRCFTLRRTIAGACRMSGSTRDEFNAWMRKDPEFNRRFTQAEEIIDDAALEIAYRETGLLPKTGGHRKLKLDRALLREILKRHPRFKPAEEKKASTEARPIEIRGIDPKILLRVTGSGMEIGINPEPPLNVVEEPKALPEPIPEVKPTPKPAFVPTFTGEEIAEMQARQREKAAAIRARQAANQAARMQRIANEGGAIEGNA